MTIHKPGGIALSVSFGLMMLGLIHFTRLDANSVITISLLFADLVFFLYLYMKEGIQLMMLSSVILAYVEIPFLIFMWVGILDSVSNPLNVFFLLTVVVISSVLGIFTIFKLNLFKPVYVTEIDVSFSNCDGDDLSFDEDCDF